MRARRLGYHGKHHPQHLEESCLAHGDELGNLVHVLLQEILILEQDVLASQDRALLPGLEGLSAVVRGCAQLFWSGLGDTVDHLTSGWVMHVDPLLSLGFHKLSVDDKLGGWDG